MNFETRGIARGIVLNQRRVLGKHDEDRLSKTDFEILTFSSLHYLFCLNDVRDFFPFVNSQYIGRSVKKLVSLKFIEIMKKGFKNKPSYFIITALGEKKLDQVLEKILQ